MESGLSYLGLQQLGIKSQYIVLRIKDIDVPKLQAATGSSFVSPSVKFADVLPKFAFDYATPFLRKFLLDKYGVDVDVKFSDAPEPNRAKSEFLPGFLVGSFVSVVVFTVKWLVKV